MEAILRRAREYCEGEMTQENIDLVKEGFAAYNRGDLDAVMATCDPSVEFKTLLLGTHTGRDAIRVLYEENQQTLAGYRLDPEEIVDVGPDQVLAVVRLGGAGPFSNIALRDPMAFLITIKDGHVLRQQTFRNKEEALVAARYET
jgi:ketosteroid isomerase-like protein